MQIDFKDYSKENEPFLKQILINITKALKLKSEYSHEQYIKELEQEFASYNGSGYAIALNSGTAALELALQAHNISVADEVILPSYTYISTALAVSNLGAKPVFADIKEDTLTIEPEEIKEKITKKTKAIIAVHIHGNPADMEKILSLAKKHKLALIEDASHAAGAEYKKIKVGNFGTGCFSCHSSKILSGIGNSGLLTTNDKKIYGKILKITQIKNDPSLDICKRTPCRINVIQAAILKTKLNFLDIIISKKINIASLYKRKLPRHINYQRQSEKGKAVYRDFVILSKHKQKLIKALSQNNIEAKPGYESPLHLTNFYKYLKYKEGDLPVTEKVIKEASWLPISHTLSEKDVNFICSRLK